MLIECGEVGKGKDNRNVFDKQAYTKKSQVAVITRNQNAGRNRECFDMLSKIRNFLDD